MLNIALSTGCTCNLNKSGILRPSLWKRVQSVNHNHICILPSPYNLFQCSYPHLFSPLTLFKDFIDLKHCFWIRNKLVQMHFNQYLNIIGSTFITLQFYLRMCIVICSTMSSSSSSFNLRLFISMEYTNWISLLIWRGLVRVCRSLILLTELKHLKV